MYAIMKPSSFNNDSNYGSTSIRFHNPWTSSIPYYQQQQTPSIIPIQQQQQQDQQCPPRLSFPKLRRNWPFVSDSLYNNNAIDQNVTSLFNMRVQQQLRPCQSNLSAYGMCVYVFHELLIPCANITNCVDRTIWKMKDSMRRVTISFASDDNEDKNNNEREARTLSTAVKCKDIRSFFY